MIDEDVPPSERPTPPERPDREQPPKPVASPTPKIEGQPRRATREIAVALDHKLHDQETKRPLWLTLLTVLLTGVGGTGVGGMVMSDGAKLRAAKAEQQLVDHLAQDDKDKRESNKRLTALEAAVVELKTEKALNAARWELALDALKVPKSKRPENTP